MCANQNQQSRGFTLMELSVALLVFLIGVLGLLQFLVFGANVNQRTRDTTLTASLAQAKVDELLRRGFSAPELARGGVVPTQPNTNPLASGNPIPVSGYVDYFRYDGTLINTTPMDGTMLATTPAGTYFIRQWQICDGCGAAPNAVPNLCTAATGCTDPKTNVLKRITVTVTSFSPAFRGSYQSTTLVVFKTRIG